MNRRLGACIIGLVGLTLGWSACEKKQKVEELPNVKLDLPDPPAFTEAPAHTADGALSVTELRRHGKKYDKKEVTVHGFINWVYRCPKEIWECRSQPAKGDKPAKLCDPCEKAHYYVAETAQDPQEKAIWVVDYPRELRDWEKQDLDPKAPKYVAIFPNENQEVSVTGTFGYESDSGFRNSRGLVVWKSQTDVGGAPAAPVGGKTKNP
jgi:hypothetical protein